MDSENLRYHRKEAREDKEKREVPKRSKKEVEGRKDQPQIGTCTFVEPFSALSWRLFLCLAFPMGRWRDFDTEFVP